MNPCKYLHFFGRGTPTAGYVFSFIQRVIRKYLNPDIRVTYDASSPFIMTKYGSVYKERYFEFDDDEFKKDVDHFVRSCEGDNPDKPHRDAGSSPVLSRIPIKSVMADKPDTKHGSDTLTAIILMSHNNFKQIESIISSHHDWNIATILSQMDADVLEKQDAVFDKHPLKEIIGTIPALSRQAIKMRDARKEKYPEVADFMWLQDFISMMLTNRDDDDILSVYDELLDGYKF